MRSENSNTTARLTECWGERARCSVKISRVVLGEWSFRMSIPNDQPLFRNAETLDSTNRVCLDLSVTGTHTPPSSFYLFPDRVWWRVQQRSKSYSNEAGKTPPPKRERDMRDIGDTRRSQSPHTTPPQNPPPASPRFGSPPFFTVKHAPTPWACALHGAPVGDGAGPIRRADERDARPRCDGKC